MIPDLNIPADDIDVRALCPYVQDLIRVVNALKHIHITQDNLGRAEVTTTGVEIDLSGLVQNLRGKGLNIETS